MLVSDHRQDWTNNTTKTEFLKRVEEASGNQGLNINNPTRKYQFKSLVGEFSGLNLASIMYAAFQQFAPGENVGTDDAENLAAFLQNKVGE